MLDPFAAPSDVNNLATIRKAVRSGLPVTGWAPAVRNPGSVERAEKEAQDFADEAKRVIADFAADKVPPDDLATIIGASYLKHARAAFLAGKRAMGNPAPLSEEDERDIARISGTLGLSDSGPAPGTFGAHLVRLASGTPGEYPDDIRDRLTKYIEDMTDAVYRAGYEQADSRKRLSLDALVASAAAGTVAADEALQLARDSGTPTVEAEADVARARRVAQRVDDTDARYATQNAKDRKALIGRIKKRQAVASKRFNERLGILLRKLLSNQITTSDAEEQLTSLIRSENVLSFTAGRSFGGTPRTKELDQEEVFLLDDTEDEEHNKFIAALPLIGAAIGALGGLTIANVIGRIANNPLNVKDPDVQRWVNRRVDGATSRFYQMRQMGEKAAFRLPGETPVISPMSDIAPLAPARDWAKEPIPIMDPTDMGSIIMVWWRLGDAQEHCLDCISLSDNSPYRADTVEAMGLAPGSGHTECGAFCRCSLEFDVPTVVAADGLIAEASTGGDLDDVYVMAARASEYHFDVATLAEVDFDMDEFAKNIEYVGNPMPMVARFSLAETLLDVRYERTEAGVRITGGRLIGAHLFEPELTIAAVRWFAEFAVLSREPLLFSESAINDGLRDWLRQMPKEPGRLATLLRVG